MCVNCAICGIRKPRRTCVAVQGDICAICCGTERERSLDCPFTCKYLREAHRHEPIAEIAPKDLPHHNVDISDEFLDENDQMLAFLSGVLFEAAVTGNSVIDLDIRAALESRTATYLGTSSDATVSNPRAAAIEEHIQQRILNLKEVVEKEAPAGAPSIMADSVVLKLLVFLQRLEYLNNNQRPRSKAFISMLGRLVVRSIPTDQTTVDPEDPRIIL